MIDLIIEMSPFAWMMDLISVRTADLLQPARA